MGALTSMQNDTLTAQVKEMINQGMGSQEIADKLSIQRDGVRAIILQQKDRVCCICKGAGGDGIAKCPVCKGLGAT